MRLIDGHVVMERLQKQTEVITNHDMVAGLLMAQGVVIEAPTIDAVEVVRKPVNGYEGYYEVDQFGRVYSVDRTIHVSDNGREYSKTLLGTQMKQNMHSQGYKTVTLTKDGESKTVYVHRLVADAFIPNPNALPMVNHKDEDKTNNFVDNLEWCTNEYNLSYGNAKERREKKIRGRSLSEEHKTKIATSLKEHYSKHESKSKGRISERRKPVIAIDSEGNELKFESISDAAKFVGITDKRNIMAACNGKKKSAYGYVWRYGERRKDDDNE